MKMLIDIPDEWKIRIEHNRRPNTIECGQLVESIWKGTPLPKGEWIPVSERLPEENGRYLATNSAWGAMEVDWNAWVNGAWLYPNTKPIAWMPLPEPYKAESEE